MLGFAWVAVMLSSCCAVQVSADDNINWQNVTGTANETFPTDVGALGDTAQPLSLPFNAQYNKPNTSEMQFGYGVEMRTLPKDARKDNATAEDIYTNLGAYTPWRPAQGLFPETEAYAQMPDQCRLKQVHLLYRHGARFPTDALNDTLAKLVNKIGNDARRGKFEPKGDLTFMNQWKYKLGQALLVHQGAQELFDAGVKSYYEYAELMQSLKHKPVIRTTSQSRMLDSARYWTLGFFGWDAHDKMNLEVLIEADKQNNTLQPKHACPNSGKFAFGDEMRKTWQRIYLKDAYRRFKKNMAGFNLTLDDMPQLISMCPYETVGIGFSHVCSAFTKEEWEGYEYEHDLKFQGNDGFMSPTGKAMGLGWVQEFVHRITKKPFVGPTAEKNMTIDNNNTYFPLDQPLYADFTHDSVIMSILTAFNFTQIGDYLDPTKSDSKRKFRASQVVPFGARVAFEVMDCQRGGRDSEQFIRVKLNEAVIPLNEDQGCEKRKDGLCKLGHFVHHLQDDLVKDADFERTCYGKNGTDFIVKEPVQNGHI